MNEPRKHHTVPQSLLRRFAIDRARKRVAVFDKTTSKSFGASIEDAGAQRDFYSIESGDQRLNLESVFQELDSRLAAVVASLATAQRLDELPSDSIADVPTLFAVQLLRTNLQRTSPLAIAERLNELGAPHGVEPITISDEQARLLHLDGLRQVDKIAELLRQKDLVIFEAAEATPTFVISDNPVVLQNTLPYGRIGLTAPGSEVYFPVSSRRCLAYLCPSHRETLVKSFDPRHPMRELTDPLYEQLMCALHLGTPARMGVESVHFLNELQLTQSGRFVYSATDDFDWARQILERRGDLRNVRTLVTIGEMGEVPPPRYPMPPGDWIIFEVGYKHYALSVFDCVFGAGTGGLTFRTSDLAKLSEIVREQPFDSVALHAGNGGGGMRDVVIDTIERSGVEYCRIQHRDEGLRSLMRSLGR